MKRAIGIFDSGLGGLTVLRELAARFPEESFCYLGDIARLPYGNKSPETIRKYGIQILEYLKNKNVKALIIACNSASTVFLGEDEYFGIPLMNVIDPGSRAALEASADKRIGVLGTAATIRSHAYKSTLEILEPKSQVWEVACPLLVPLVEEGFIKDPITEVVLERYLSQIKKDQVKTLILGCTHYPVLREDFRKVLGPDVKLVESGRVLGDEISKFVPMDKGPRTIEIHITDLTDHFERLARELMGAEPFTLEKVVL